MRILSVLLLVLLNLNISAQDIDKPYGIAMGVGYFTASVDSALIGNAIIDDNGVIRVTDERERITRLFPTIMGYVKPFHKIKRKF